MPSNTSAAVMPKREVPKQGAIDYFPTPYWATQALCEWLAENHFLLGGETCWEPAAGGGHMVEILEKYFSNVIATDLHDPANMGYEKLDFLENADVCADWIITNPPFVLAEEFALRAIDKARKGSAMLCRIAFLETIGRYKNLFRDTPPSDVLVFSERLGMAEGRLDAKATAAICYAWFVWDGSDDGDTQLHWIPPGSKDNGRRDGALLWT